MGTVAVVAPGFSNERCGAADHVKSWGVSPNFLGRGGPDFPSGCALV